MKTTWFRLEGLSARQAMVVAMFVRTIAVMKQSKVRGDRHRRPLMTRPKLSQDHCKNGWISPTGASYRLLVFLAFCMGLQPFERKEGFGKSFAGLTIL